MHFIFLLFISIRSIIFKINKIIYGINTFFFQQTAILLLKFEFVWVAKFE